MSSIDKFQQLACPLDGLKLQTLGNTLTCPQGHSYDIARQGYVNLLPVQQKKSREPGDSKEMIAARKRHLDAGFYAPIATRLAELSVSHSQQGAMTSCLDAGCGEGYYLSFYADYLEQKKRGGVYLTGLDISKAAIIAAAKRQSDITWVVGNSQHAPVMSSSVNLIWSVFGFHHLHGFRNMLCQNGKLIMVEAGPQHLIEIREIIYSHVRQTESVSQKEFDASGFCQIDRQTLTYQTAPLSSDQLADLLLMTPHLFRASSEGKQAMSQVQNMVLTVDVSYRVFELA